MTKTSTALALLAAAGLTLTALAAGAQDQPAAPVVGDAPAADGLSLGTPADGSTGAPQPGQTYTLANFDSWEQRCVKTASGKDPCQLYQLLKDQSGNAVSEISLFPLPPGGQAAAGATIVTPLETLLTEQLHLVIDGGTPKTYPFTFCSQIGCVSRVGFTAAEIDEMKKGAKAVITIVPVVAPTQKVVVDVSLSGFTAGFQAVTEANTIAEEAARAAAPAPAQAEGVFTSGN